MTLFRPFSLVAILVGVLFARSSPGQLPVGTLVKRYPFRASRLLADPTRPRVYAVIPATDSVNVIDTDSMEVIATLPVGKQPGDLAISRDGGTLYTANRQSSGPDAVSVIDLATLQAKPGLALPGGLAWSVAAGRQGRLYVAAISQEGGLWQVDTVGGAAPQKIDTGDYRSTYLQLSPNGKKLYDIDAGSVRLDVSTPTATVLQSDGWAFERGADELRVSHNGKTLCRPSTDDGSITLYRTKNFQAVGTLDMDDEPGPLAFSPDDSLLYEVPHGPAGRQVWVYDTHTFARTLAVNLPWKDYAYWGYDVADVTTDTTGNLLFVSSTSEDGADSTLAVATGKGAPTGGLPGVSLWTDTLQIATDGNPEHGSFSVSRSGDLSNPLTVYYDVGGTAPNGVFYQSLPGAVTIPAGEAITHIEVVPLPPASNGSGQIATVRLTLLPGASYTPVQAKAKLRMYP